MAYSQSPPASAIVTSPIPYPLITTPTLHYYCPFYPPPNRPKPRSVLILSNSPHTFLQAQPFLYSEGPTFFVVHPSHFLSPLHLPILSIFFLRVCSLSSLSSSPSLYTGFSRPIGRSTFFLFNSVHPLPPHLGPFFTPTTTLNWTPSFHASLYLPTSSHTTPTLFPPPCSSNHRTQSRPLQHPDQPGLLLHLYSTTGPILLPSTRPQHPTEPWQ